MIEPAINTAKWGELFGRGNNVGNFEMRGKKWGKIKEMNLLFEKVPKM
jgi:hypothetical protein